MQTEQLLQELGITQWRLRAAALSNAKLDGDVAPKDVEQADIQANSQLDGQASAKNDTGCWPLAFNLLEGRQSGILQGRTWGALYKPEVLSNAEQTLLSNILQALSVQPQVDRKSVV